MKTSQHVALLTTADIIDEMSIANLWVIDGKAIFEIALSAMLMFHEHEGRYTKDACIEKTISEYSTKPVEITGFMDNLHWHMHAILTDLVGFSIEFLDEQFTALEITDLIGSRLRLRNWSAETMVIEYYL